VAKTETIPWDAADHLDSPAAVVAYLNAAFEDGDPAVIAAALGDVARSRGMSAVARDAGLGRTSLYKALSEDGKPEFSTVMRVVQSLGLRLSVALVETPKAPGL